MEEVIVKIGDKEMGRFSIEDRIDMPITFKQKDYVEGSVIIESESGIELKMPCKVYNNGSFVANVDDEYRLEGKFNPEDVKWI